MTDHSCLSHSLKPETAIAFLLLIPASHLWAGNSLLPRQKETQYQSLREMSLIHSKDDSNIFKWNICIRHQRLTSINLCGRVGELTCAIQKNTNSLQAPQNKLVASQWQLLYIFSESLSFYVNSTKWTAGWRIV